jgi:hypothetical protein
MDDVITIRPSDASDNSDGELPSPIMDLPHRIFLIRSRRVMLGPDLAEVYGVSAKRLNEQVRRNQARFPDDFCFQLTLAEASALLASRSQSAALKRGQNLKYALLAFTDHGAVMLAGVLNSPAAIAEHSDGPRLRAAALDGGDVRRASPRSSTRSSADSMICFASSSRRSANSWHRQRRRRRRVLGFAPRETVRCRTSARERCSRCRTSARVRSSGRCFAAAVL